MRKFNIDLGKKWHNGLNTKPMDLLYVHGTKYDSHDLKNMSDLQ